MIAENTKTWGLALSGSGNRSPFYIGFLEVLSEEGLKPDCISACSGGSLVAAAYACGTLPEFKERVFGLTPEILKGFLQRDNSHGGLFNIDKLEDEIRVYTKGLNFEDTRPLMGFAAVDIENGEKVFLSMGDMAKAARISCTLPGVFEPVKWGGKTLVDGGLLVMVPGRYLREAGMSVTVGVNMRGTRHIFTQGQINAKKLLNFFKKMLFVDDISQMFGNLFGNGSHDATRMPGMFEVIGKSLDLAIKANKQFSEHDEECDLMICPDIPKLKKDTFSPQTNRYYYQKGRETALEYLPKIQNLIGKE